MVEASNPFLVAAERQLTVPTRRKLARREQRAQIQPTPEEKAEIDRERQFRLWLQWRREQYETLFTGEYGNAARTLVDLLKTLCLEDGQKLVDLVISGPWKQADSDTRYLILGLIDQYLARLRERHRLAPFDDSLPFSDEPPTVFEIIRTEWGHDC